MTRIWLALAVFLTSHPLYAGPKDPMSPDQVSTRELVRFCSWVTNWGEGFCRGYLARMIESYDCYVPDPTRPALGYFELVGVYLDYVEKNPESTGQPAAKTLSTVLTENWPCP